MGGRRGSGRHGRRGAPRLDALGARAARSTPRRTARGIARLPVPRKRSRSARRACGSFCFVSATCVGGAVGDVDGRVRRDAVARLEVGEDDGALGHLRRAGSRRGPGSARSASALRAAVPVREAVARRRAGRRGARPCPAQPAVALEPRRAARARTIAAAMPASPPKSAIHVASGGPPSCSRFEKSPGYSSSSTIPAASATGSTNTRSARASTAAPPANANANGTKPAARRDCESDTRSEKRGNTNGQSSSASTSTVPPRTNALQRRRAANAASGTRTSAATAIAPVRAGSPGAR